jgi:chromosome segregation ATPase
MLDGYASEYKSQRDAANRLEIELDQLRYANRNLSSQLKQVEASLAQINQEHVELVKELVESRLAREETENELVRYKLLYAELAHADEMSIHSRRSLH